MFFAFSYSKKIYSVHIIENLLSFIVFGFFYVFLGFVVFMISALYIGVFAVIFQNWKELLRDLKKEKSSLKEKILLFLMMAAFSIFLPLLLTFMIGWGMSTL